MPLEDGSSSATLNTQDIWFHHTPSPDSKSNRRASRTITPSTTASSFASVFKNGDARPVVRRQRSLSETDSSSSIAPSASTTAIRKRSQHSRSRTTESSAHPLGGASGRALDGTITRPTLRRLLHVWDTSVGLRETEQDRGEDIVHGPKEAEKEVLVHEVSPKDSLAGVALKFGITIADLRRANQLWASDSIHLRKVLYIPVELSRYRATRSLGPTPPEIVSGAEEDRDTELPDESPAFARTNSTILRRVPVSKLSFFPPPAEPAALFSSSHHSSSYTGSASGSPSRSGSHTPQTSPPLSLTSLFAAFPLPAVVRDNPVSRISFESSGSQGGRSDETVEELGHEMNDISGMQSRLPLKRGEITRAVPLPFRGVGVDEERSRPSVVRTAQLEPSPSMQVPPSKSKLRY